MKKKLYLQPAIDVMGIQPLQMLNATRGWSQDGNPPTEIEIEPGVSNSDIILPSTGGGGGDDDDDDDGDYGGFLDLD